MTASPYDGPLSAIRSHVDDLGVWLGIWKNRREPDAHALVLRLGRMGVSI